MRNVFIAILVSVSVLFVGCNTTPAPVVSDPKPNLVTQTGLVINWNEGITIDQRGGETKLFALSEASWTYSEGNVTSTRELVEQGVTIKTPLPGWETTSKPVTNWMGVLVYEDVTINGSKYAVGRIYPSAQSGAGVVQWALFRK